MEGLEEVKDIMRSKYSLNIPKITPWVGELSLDKWYHLGFRILCSQVRAWGDTSKERWVWKHTHLLKSTASNPVSSMESTQRKEFLTYLQKAGLTQVFLSHGQRSRTEETHTVGGPFRTGLAKHDFWFFSPLNSQSEEYSSIGEERECGGREKERSYFSQTDKIVRSCFVGKTEC